MFRRDLARHFNLGVSRLAKGCRGATVAVAILNYEDELKNQIQYTLYRCRIVETCRERRGEVCFGGSDITRPQEDRSGNLDIRAFQFWKRRKLYKKKMLKRGKKKREVQ